MFSGKRLGEDSPTDDLFWTGILPGTEAQERGVSDLRKSVSVSVKCAHSTLTLTLYSDTKYNSPSFHSLSPDSVLVPQ